MQGAHAAMPQLCSFVWGLVGGQIRQGQLVDTNTALTVQAAGWDPPLNAQSAASIMLQQLPGPSVLAGTLSSSSADKSAGSTLRQLAVGWSHALLLLSSGHAYVCDASTWQDSCSQHDQAAACSPGWQLLQLPIASLQQQQQHPPPPRPACDLAASQKVAQVAAGDKHCLLLTEAGAVWAFGSNKYGQVGSMQEVKAGMAQHRSAQDTGSSCRTGQHSPCMESAILQEEKAGNRAAGQQDAAQRRRQRLLQLRQRQQQFEQQHVQQVQQEQRSFEQQQAGLARTPQHVHRAEPVLVLGPGAHGDVCQEPVLQVSHSVVEDLRYVAGRFSASAS